MTVIPCPKTSHFHVIGRDVFALLNFEEVIECLSPNEALSTFITTLPDDWEGSIEVKNDKTRRPSALALIDFWRTPLKTE